MAVLDAAAEVTGAVPAVPQRGSRRLGLLVVTGHQAGRAHPELALLTVGDVRAAPRIDDAHVHTRHGRPAGTVDPGPLGTIGRDHAAGLGAAVRVEQRRPQGLLHGRAQGGATGRARHEAQPQRRRGRTGRVDQPVVRRRHTGQQGEGPAEFLVGREQLPSQTARPRQLPGDPGARAHGRHAQDGQRVAETVEQRKRPQQSVVGRETEHRGVAGGHGPQRGPLRGQHALRPVGGARGVEHPGRLVEAERVDPGGLGNFFALGGPFALGHVVEQPDALRDRAGARDQDAQAVVRRSQVPQPGEARGVRDDERGTAVLQEVRQLRVRGPRVERDTDQPGPQDGEAALHRLHTVAEADRDAVAATQPRPQEVRRQAPGAPLQLAVGDAARGVGVRDPARRRPGVLLQQVRHRPDQLVTPHVLHPSNPQPHNDVERTWTRGRRPARDAGAGAVKGG